MGEEGPDRNNTVHRERERHTATPTIPGLVVEVVADIVVEGGPETRQREWKDSLQTISHAATLKSYLKLTIKQ